MRAAGSPPRRTSTSALQEPTKADSKASRIRSTNRSRQWGADPCINLDKRRESPDTGASTPGIVKKASRTRARISSATCRRRTRTYHTRARTHELSHGHSHTAHVSGQSSAHPLCSAWRQTPHCPQHPTRTCRSLGSDIRSSHTLLKNVHHLMYRVPHGNKTGA